MSRPVVVLEGFLGKDPEQREGSKLVKFSVACQVGKEEVNWYDIAVWEESLKTFVLSYLKRGSRVLVSGQQVINEKDGKKYVNINANSIQFVSMGKKKDGDENKEATEAPAEATEAPAEEATPKTDDVPF